MPTPTTKKTQGARLHATLRRAVFIGAAVFAASVTARATPPCATSEMLVFTVESVRIDGSDQKFTPVDAGALYLFPRNDADGGVFLAAVYDPATDMARDAELKEAP